VQEALARAWRRRARCRNQSAPLPWVLEITRNEARRIRARSLSRAEVGLDEAPLDRLAEDGLEDAVDRAAVGAALASLSAEDRTLLEMRYWADLTQASLAEVLGVAEGTVKVRLHRLRHRLRGALESEE
jgi:RNA polymerase sigma-70 factor, ECF subfamily